MQGEKKYPVKICRINGYICNISTVKIGQTMNKTKTKIMTNKEIPMNAIIMTVGEQNIKIIYGDNYFHCPKIVKISK